MKDIVHEILLGFWKVHILHHAGEGPVYGKWIIDELRRHGYDISPGTVYPLLQRLENHGWLRSERAEAAGPRTRKNYRLTKKGKQVLRRIRPYVRELYEEVLIGPGEKKAKP